MVSIGVTNKNHISALKKICENIAEVTYITRSKDISKFDVIVLSENGKIQICNTVSTDTFLIIDSDIISPLDIVCQQKVYIITYGLNSKATLTASSLDGNQTFLCLQRTVIDINNNEIEPQEFSILKNDKYDVAELMSIVATCIVCGIPIKKLSSFMF